MQAIKNFYLFKYLFIHIKFFYLSGVTIILSKDSRPNFRDLYKNKGKKLVDDKNKAINEADEKLAKGISNLSSRNSSSPVISEKMLHLGFTKIHQGDSKISAKKLSYKHNKTEIQMLVLKFGVVYQRASGSAISNQSSFYEQFCKFHSEITKYTEKDFNETLEYLSNEGLLYQFVPEILFEPLERSKDINAIFRLVKPQDESITLTTIKSKLAWSDDKITNVIDQLVSNNLAVLDGEILWFPQLSN